MYCTNEQNFFWHLVSFGLGLTLYMALSIKLIWQIMHPGILVRLLCPSSNYLPASPPPTLGRHTTHLVPALHGNTKAGSKATAIKEHYHSSSAITLVIIMIRSLLGPLPLTDTLYTRSRNNYRCLFSLSPLHLLNLFNVTSIETQLHGHAEVMVCCWFKPSANTLKCYRMSSVVPEEW